MDAPRVLLIDNIDSFTFNIADLVHRVLGVPATVWRHDADIDPGTGAGERWWQDFDAVIVGPGPGRPEHAADMGLSRAALRQRDVPVLGVCLGHQGLAAEAGWTVSQMEEPHHGRVAQVHHDGTGLFAGVPSPFAVVRYHSLDVRAPVTDSPERNAGLTPTAWSTEDGCVMGLADVPARQWGVQFHPESVLTEHGATILANFFSLAGVTSAAEATPAVGVTPAAGVTSADGSAPTGTPVGELDNGPTGGVREVGLRVERLDAQVFAWDLHAALARLRAEGGDDAVPDTSVWLDSSDNHGVSVLADASGPLGYTVTHRVGQGSEISTGEQLSGTMWENLSALLGRVRLVDGDAPATLPFEFRPGLIGYFGYELRGESGDPSTYRAQTPDAWLTFADRAVVIEHSTRRIYLLALVDEAVAGEQETWVEAVRALVADLSAGRAVEPVTPAPTTFDAVSADAHDAVVAAAARHTRAQYEELVDRAQQQIRAGETYEVCLTNQVDWPEVVDERSTYRRLRTISPGPFGAWLRCGEFSVLSSSPERFVSLRGDGVVRAEPIKGTRPRDTTPSRDAELARELAADPKERAENLMIVDLLRNDLHRVCEPRSVSVPELFAVRSWTTVHQLVSTITGRLRPGAGPADVLRSCFPGGSMTGAPKVRTMQILEDLEGGPRGVYSGAIGWVGLNGAMDTSIVIRTIVLRCGAASFGIGGAVTSLSSPSEEYAETLTKARSVASALAGH